MPQLDTVYKVRARGLPNWKEYDNVRLEVSVGQPYHEGQKLAATMDWARSNFSLVTVIVGDLPQRYNLMIEEGLSSPDAWHRAKAAGDGWLIRNSEALQNVDVTRWQDWIENSRYQETLLQAKRLFLTNLDFNRAVINALNEKFSRDDLPREKYEVFKRLSIEYLLEETAVFAVAYRELKGVSAYPGSFLEMWSMFLDKEIPEAPEGLRYAHCIRLQYERRKAAISVL